MALADAAVLPNRCEMAWTAEVAASVLGISICTVMVTGAGCNVLIPASSSTPAVVVSNRTSVVSVAAGKSLTVPPAINVTVTTSREGGEGGGEGGRCRSGRGRVGGGGR